MKLEIRPFGTDRHARKLEAIAERTNNPRPLFLSISDDLADIGRRRFRTGGDGGWDRLKASSVARKARAGQFQRLGWASGELAASLSRPRGRNASRRITRTRMTWHTKLFYAKFRDREWFEMSERDHAAIERKIERYLMTGDL